LIFVHDARILKRHVPAGKVHQTRVQCNMTLE
jgi:hypothetical protein